MTAVSAPHAPIGRGTIRTLTAREMPLLRAHLLRLDAESRRDRFNGAVDEKFIESYAERCLADGTVVVAYVEDEQVLAAAELHQPDTSCDGLPEIAFSVEHHVRRKWLGSILFRRLITEADGRGYERLRITTQLVGLDNKRFRWFQAMYHAEKGYLAATCEWMILFIDMTQRRVTEIPPAARARLDQVMAAHAALPQPPELGRNISLSNKRRSS